MGWDGYSMSGGEQDARGVMTSLAALPEWLASSAKYLFKHNNPYSHGIAATAAREGICFRPGDPNHPTRATLLTRLDPLGTGAPDDFKAAVRLQAYSEHRPFVNYMPGREARADEAAQLRWNKTAIRKSGESHRSRHFLGYYSHNHGRMQADDLKHRVNLEQPVKEFTPFAFSKDELEECIRHASVSAACTDTLLVEYHGEQPPRIALTLASAAAAPGGGPAALSLVSRHGRRIGGAGITAATRDTFSHRQARGAVVAAIRELNMKLNSQALLQNPALLDPLIDDVETHLTDELEKLGLDAANITAYTGANSVFGRFTQAIRDRAEYCKTRDMANFIAGLEKQEQEKYFTAFKLARQLLDAGHIKRTEFDEMLHTVGNGPNLDEHLLQRLQDLNAQGVDKRFNALASGCFTTSYDEKGKKWYNFNSSAWTYRWSTKRSQRNFIEELFRLAKMQGDENTVVNIKLTPPQHSANDANHKATRELAEYAHALAEAYGIKVNVKINDTVVQQKFPPVEHTELFDEVAKAGAAFAAVNVALETDMAYIEKLNQAYRKIERSTDPADIQKKNEITHELAHAMGRMAVNAPQYVRLRNKLKTAIGAVRDKPEAVTSGDHRAAVAMTHGYAKALEESQTRIAARLTATATIIAHPTTNQGLYADMQADVNIAAAQKQELGVADQELRVWYQSQDGDELYTGDASANWPEELTSPAASDPLVNAANTVTEAADNAWAKAHIANPWRRAR